MENPNSAVDDGQASGRYTPRFRIYFRDIDLGWVDSREHAEGFIRQNLKYRRRGQHYPVYRREYRIEEVLAERDGEEE